MTLNRARGKQPWIEITGAFYFIFIERNTLTHERKLNESQSWSSSTQTVICPVSDFTNRIW